MHTIQRFPIVLVVAVAACSGGSSTTNPPPPPPPPTTAVGYLWVTAGSTIGAFTQAQTSASSTALPDLSLQFNVGHTLGDLALDRSGNIWAVGVGSNRIFRFRASSTPGLVTPDLTISSSNLNRPWGLAFDNAGNLWVSNSASATAGSSYSSIVRFNNPQGLSGNQTLSASLVIAPPATGAVKEYYGLVHGLAFASNGDLWAGGPSTLLRFINPQSLTGNITPTPDGVIIRDGYGAGFGFSGMLAFDASGALWATGCQGLTPCVDFAVKFSNPVFAGVSSPNPNVRLTLGDNRSSNGMAFDAGGSLWIIFDTIGRGIVRIAPAGLTANGTATFATTLYNPSISGLSKIVFFPTPAGLPIY
jgi:sugar lactone lactonase YvrE